MGTALGSTPIEFCSSRSCDAGKQLSAAAHAEVRVGKIAVAGRLHQLPRRFEDDYQVTGEVLGKGFHGEVCTAVSKLTGAVFALKRLRLDGMSSELRMRMQVEVELLLCTDHPHLVKLYDVYISPEYLHLVMERLGDEVVDRLQKRRKFGERQAAGALRQMFLAVAYLHGQGIAHRDLKLENFLFEDSSSGEEDGTLKLIDLGFAEFCRPGEELSLGCGSRGYIAPEVMQGAYTVQCDIWSLGVIAYTLLIGQMPFASSRAAMARSVAKGSQCIFEGEAWELVSPAALDLVTKLLVVDPRARLTAEQALRHPWITEHAPAGLRFPLSRHTLSRALLGFAKLSPFLRACRSIAAMSLTRAEHSVVRDAFDELRFSDSGVIELRELRFTLEGGGHLASEEVDMVIAAFGASHTGNVSYSDVAAAVCGSAFALTDDHLVDTFRRLDRHGNGFVSTYDVVGVFGESFLEALTEVPSVESGMISYAELSSFVLGKCDAPV